MKWSCLLLILSVSLLASCVAQRRAAEREQQRLERERESEERRKKGEAELERYGEEVRRRSDEENEFREKWHQEAAEAKKTCDEWMEKSNSDPAFEDYAAKHDLIHRMCSLEAEWESIYWGLPPFAPSLDKAIKLRRRQMVLLRLYWNYEKRKWEE